MWWIDPAEQERLKSDLAERIREANEAVEKLSPIKRIEHDLAQQLSWSAGYNPGPDYQPRVTVRLCDLHAIIALAKQATGEE